MPSNQMLARSTSRRNLRRIIQNASTQAACKLNGNIVCRSAPHCSACLVFIQSEVDVVLLLKISTKSDHSSWSTRLRCASAAGTRTRSVIHKHVDNNVQKRNPTIIVGVVFIFRFEQWHYDRLTPIRKKLTNFSSLPNEGGSLYCLTYFLFFRNKWESHDLANRFHLCGILAYWPHKGGVLCCLGGYFV